MARIRRTGGRRKIEIKKINKESNLHVTFSKRRNGIFKKASELCTLCAAEVAIIVFSPGNKVLSFGHPSVNGVVNRLFSDAPPLTTSAMQVIEAIHNCNLRNLNSQLTEFSNRLDTERKRSTEFNKLLNPAMEKFWWASPIEEMSKPQLEFLLPNMEELKRAITLQADMMRILGSNPSQPFAGSSSSPVTPQPASLPLIQPLVVQANHALDGNMIPPPPASHGLSNLGGFSPGFY